MIFDFWAGLCHSKQKGCGRGGDQSHANLLAVTAQADDDSGIGTSSLSESTQKKNKGSGKSTQKKNKGKRGGSHGARFGPNLFSNASVVISSVRFLGRSIGSCWQIVHAKGQHWFSSRRGRGQ